MSGVFTRHNLQVVVKISKYCNLRCSYCYEYAELGNRATISIANFEKLFNNLSAYTPVDCNGTSLDSEELKLVWHGGEPFMVKLTYYEEIGRLQRAIFGERFHCNNSAQTNLTVLTDEHLQHLQERRFFQSIGISFDVYGDQRIDAKGRSSTDKVLRNLQRLKDSNINFGGIAVLSRDTLSKIANVYKFYNSIDVQFRVLPFHLAAFEDQTGVHGLRSDEIASAMCEVFDLWLQSENPTMVLPIDSYIDYAIAYMSGASKQYYDKDADENVLVVNTDGTTYGVVETYQEQHCYGNMFDQSLEEIFASPNRRRMIAESSARVEKYCARCPYFGACPGMDVSEANPIEAESLRLHGCYIRAVVGHIVKRFEETGLDGVARPHRDRPQFQPSSAIGVAL